MSKPREYTNKEIRDMVLGQVWDMVDYWAECPPTNRNLRERMAGLAFSILTMIDGDCIALPAFRVCSDPHADDKEYRRSRGINWFPENEGELNGEITEIPLHEVFFELDPKRNDNETWRRLLEDIEIFFPDDEIT